MKGIVHSFETCGTVDGPGIRFVLFLKGCPLRCAFCHNPDTWSLEGGKAMTAEEIYEIYNANSSFYKSGGITISGGEPLYQMDFLIELCSYFHERGVHVCVDTSGALFNKLNHAKFDTLINYVDLFLLDIKEVNEVDHLSLTGVSLTPVKDFLDYLEQKQIEVWIRHVVVPTLNDNKDKWIALGKFLAPYSIIKCLEVLPYHTLGVNKYDELKIPYALKGIPALDKEVAKDAQRTILESLKKERGDFCGGK